MIGLTSRAMQLDSDITDPDCAPLMDDMFFASGSDILIDRFIAPRAIEIIDARIEQFDRDTQAPRKVFDTVSDFAADAGIVMAAARCGR